MPSAVFWKVLQNDLNLWAKTMNGMRKQHENGTRLLHGRAKVGETEANEKHHDISFLSTTKNAKETKEALEQKIFHGRTSTLFYFSDRRMCIPRAKGYGTSRAESPKAYSPRHRLG